jgi:cell division protease FtsH
LSDLEKVTKQAYAMVSIYGLNKKVGNVSYYDSQGRDSFTKPYSEDTARIIDQEVSALIEQQYKRALETLTKHQDKLILLADKLLKTEVIFKEDLEIIFGKRIWDKDQLLEDATEATIKPKPKRIPKKAIAAPDSTTDLTTDSTIETSTEPNE